MWLYHIIFHTLKKLSNGHFIFFGKNILDCCKIEYHRAEVGIGTLIKTKPINFGKKDENNTFKAEKGREKRKIQKVPILILN